jgi:hypothetical protein
LSLRLSTAAVRAYDLLKQRPGAPRRRSDARDPEALAAVTRRLEELIAAYRVNSHQERGATYVFWTEVAAQVEAGAFDDLVGGL